MSTTTDTHDTTSSMTTTAGATPEETWKPTLAGICNIISGLSSWIGAAVLLFMVLFMSGIFQMPDVQQDAQNFPFGLAVAFFGCLAAFCFVLGAVAIWGGILEMQRRSFAWAVAASIAAVLAFFPLGIAAVIFTVMAEKEFAA